MGGTETRDRHQNQNILNDIISRNAAVADFKQYKVNKVTNPTLQSYNPISQSYHIDKASIICSPIKDMEGKVNLSFKYNTEVNTIFTVYIGGTEQTNERDATIGFKSNQQKFPPPVTFRAIRGKDL